MGLQETRFVPGINYSRCFVVCVLAFSTVAAYSQSTFGDIRGAVRDPSSLAVPQAVVTLHSVDENTTRVATSDDSGGYLFENLKPGDYTLSAAKTGFSESPTIALQLTARQSARADLSLSIAQVEQTVNVEGAAQQIN